MGWNVSRILSFAVALALLASACGDSEKPAASTASDQPEISVWFSTGDGSDCSQVTGFARDIPTETDSIQAAFDELVSGPTDSETAEGADSFWSAGTSEVVRSVKLQDGLLVVDFDDLSILVPNASTSCGSEALLAGLNRTAFQFPQVERVRYTIDGSCDIFGNWLQRECVEFTPSGQVPVDLPTNERADGSGCTPPSDALGNGRWFGYISSAAATEVEFDLACWFTGSAASDAATEDGEESPPPNDYYVRNANDRLRTIPMHNDAIVTWLPNPSDPSTTISVLYGTWLTERSARGYQPGVWLSIDDGVVTSIEEQYVP